MRDLRARTAFYGPQDRYLLLVDRIGPGYLGNPTLAKYLQWYSLDKRVMLLATGHMRDIVEQLQQECDGPCRGKPTAEVVRALKLKTPFEVSNAKLTLLGLQPSSNNWPGVVRDVGVAVYPGAPRAPAFGASDMWLYTGIVVAEPRWTPPPPAAAAAGR